MTLLAALLALAAAAIGLGAAPAAAAPSGQYAEWLSFRLSTIEPAIVTADGPDRVTLVGRYTNTGTDPVDDFEFRFQRGPALTTQAAVRAEVDEPSQPAEVVTGFRDLPGSLQPGDSAPFAITVPVFSGSAADANPAVDGLDISEPGVYPVMLNFNATVHIGEETPRARVGELHVLVTVTSVPGAVGGGTGHGNTGDGAAVPVSILWPLADRPHRSVDGVFADDALARTITGGGRLAVALAALEQADSDPNLVTIVVDPMLLDELESMALGYRVLTQPGAVQQRLRPDGVIPGTVPGTGRAAAQDYLQRLRALAATHRVLVLPYGDADLAALTRADMHDEAAAAITRGRDAATRVLVRGPEASAIYRNLITDIAMAPGGMMTGATVSLAYELGDRGAIVAPGSVANTAGTSLTQGLVTVTSGITAKDALHGVVAGGSRATQFEKILAGDITQDTVRAVNLLAAELQTTPGAQRSPVVVAPTRQFTPNPAGLAALTDLVADLADSHMMRPVSISTLLDARSTTVQPATLTYSAAARNAELPLGYLRRIEDMHRQIDALKQSLRTSIETPGAADPRDLLDPLSDALMPAVSSTWRGSADPAGTRLQTVNSTLTWLYGGVQIGRDTGSHTLASSTAPLLLTVQNTLPYEVSVSVGIIGGAQAGLQATGPAEVLVGPGPRSVPVKLDTSVSRSGTFTVFAQLYGADGTEWSGAVPLTIDSRAYGALTVILMATAGGVLILMVIWRLVQRVRGRIDDPDNRLVNPEDDGSTDSVHPANDVIPIRSHTDAAGTLREEP